MPRTRRTLRGGAFTRDGLPDMLAGLGLAIAGYLLLPATPPQPDMARWAYVPVVAAALLLPALKAIVRRFVPTPDGRVAAGWGWALGALLALALGGAALALVWLEIESPLLTAALRTIDEILKHATASLGLVLGVLFILVGYANDQWRLAIEGMAWAVLGLGVDGLLWGDVLPLWYCGLFTTRHVTALYLLALGGLTALLGLIALVRYVALRERDGNGEVTAR